MIAQAWVDICENRLHIQTARLQPHALALVQDVLLIREQMELPP